MSVKQSGQVWELDLDPIDKLVLLALADHADHDGNNVRPGNDLLCAKTGLSQPTVTAKLKKFVECGILDPKTNATPGRGNLREFSLRINQVARAQYFIDREKVKAAFTFQNNQKVQDGSTFSLKKVKAGSGQKVKADDEKVKAGDGKVKAGEIPHDKERARNEPSIEPSIEPSGGTMPLDDLGGLGDQQIPASIPADPRTITDALNELFPAEESNQNLMLQLTDLVLNKCKGTAADVDRWADWLARRWASKVPNYHEFKSTFPLMMKEGRPGNWLNGSIGSRFTLLTFGFEPEADVAASLQNRVLTVGHWLDDVLRLDDKEAWKSRGYTPQEFLSFWKSRFPHSGKPSPESIQKYWEEFEAWLKETRR